MSADSNEADVIILGGGAAGLMCARTAGRRGKRVIVLEQGSRAGGKIRIAGGGKCNFTNRDCQPKHYFSANAHFVKSALARFRPADMLALLDEHGVEWEERQHGRLFCRHSAGQIVNLLLEECRACGVDIRYSSTVRTVRHASGGYEIHTGTGDYHAPKLVVALGGAAWPQCGATTLGYDIATQFALEVTTPRPGLAPLLYGSDDLTLMEPLSGASIMGKAGCAGQSFTEEILFTHRGLSGPAILQVSCLWHNGQIITIDWLPGRNAEEMLTETRLGQGGKSILKLFEGILPQRFVKLWQDRYLPGKPLPQWSRQQLQQAGAAFNAWPFVPAGTEGFAKAETTLGGVCVDELSSKTLESTKMPGLYFIGEVVDVAGQLGGYNLHWAWASGHCAGLAI